MRPGRVVAVQPVQCARVRPCLAPGSALWRGCDVNEVGINLLWRRRDGGRGREAVGGGLPPVWVPKPCALHSAGAHMKIHQAAAACSRLPKERLVVWQWRLKWRAGSWEKVAPRVFILLLYCVRVVDSTLWPTVEWFTLLLRTDWTVREGALCPLFKVRLNFLTHIERIKVFPFNIHSLRWSPRFSPYSTLNSLSSLYFLHVLNIFNTLSSTWRLKQLKFLSFYIFFNILHSNICWILPFFSVIILVIIV